MSHEEDHVVSALCDLAHRMSIKCVVQVGAHDGYEADCIRNATGCRAVTIEGNSLCAPISKGLEYHTMVIGATDGMTTFYRHGSAELSGQFRRGDSSEEAVECQQMRLDTFCRLHKVTPDALIVDTEGSSLDVLEGCGDAILDNLRMVYAETQNVVLRPGIRLVGEVDKLLVAHGMTMHHGLPSYDAGSQGNTTWVRNGKS